MRHLKKQRPLIWGATLSMISDAPLVGHGLGAFYTLYPKYGAAVAPEETRRAFHAHNDWLEIQAETGLPGTLAFLAFITLGLWTAIRNILTFDQLPCPPPYGQLGALGSLAALCILMFLSFPLYRAMPPLLLFFSIGMIAAAQRHNRFTSSTFPSSVATQAILLFMAYGALGLFFIQLHWQPGRLDIARLHRQLELSQFPKDSGKVIRLTAELRDKGELSAKGRHERTRALMADRRLPEALKSARAAMRVDPYSREGKANLGLLLTMTGNAQEALPVLEEVLGSGLRHLSIYQALVQAGFDLERPECAEKILRRAVLDQPDNAQLWGLLAKTYSKRGDEENARQALERARSILQKKRAER